MKSVFKIGSSEELNPSQAVLLMEIGEGHCCFAIFDFANQMVVQLAYYTAEDKGNEDILNAILEIHPELKQSFRQTVVSYYLPESILVPSKFYKYEDMQTILSTMYEKSQHVVVSESLGEWQAYNSYRVPATIHQFLSRWHSAGNFWHTYSITLKNGIDKSKGCRLIVDFKVDSFSVVAVKDHSLLLTQIFPYAKAEDVLYWLLKICNQFSISQQQVSLVLSGLIDKQSAVFKELYQYFLNIEFASIENDIQLSGEFEDYPVHFFSSIFKLASCVS